MVQQVALCGMYLYLVKFLLRHAESGLYLFNHTAESLSLLTWQSRDRQCIRQRDDTHILHHNDKRSPKGVAWSLVYIIYIDTGQYEILGIYIHTLWKWAIGRKASSSSNSTSSLRTSCYTTHHHMLCYELCTYSSIHSITHMTVLWDVLRTHIHT